MNKKDKHVINKKKDLQGVTGRGQKHLICNKQADHVANEHDCKENTNNLCYKLQ